MTKPTETLKLKVQSLEDQISTLIDVISAQNKKIDRLEKVVLSLSQINFESPVPEQKPKYKRSKLIDEIRSLMVCPDCGENNLDVRRNKTTCVRFVQCPRCQKAVNTKMEFLKEDIPCPKCDKGWLIFKTNSQTKEAFLGCSEYPHCKGGLNIFEDVEEV